MCASFWNPILFCLLKRHPTNSVKYGSLFISLNPNPSLIRFWIGNATRFAGFLFFSFSFFSPNFPSFFFFSTKKNKRRERICKKRVFSRFEFLRTFYEVYGCIRAVFSTSLARAVPSQRARVEGTGKGVTCHSLVQSWCSV